MKLNDIHRRMLEAGTFHLDGWTSPRGHQAASELKNAGYVTSFENSSGQYTAINYEITDAGRVALAS